MIELMNRGGIGMWPILLMGVVGVWTAGWFAWRAEARVRGFLDQIARAVVYATLVSLALAVMMTLFAAVQVEPAHKTTLVMKGLGESMTPLVLGFALLSLIHLLTAIGQRRLDGKIS
jgi:hypothetical protein